MWWFQVSTINRSRVNIASPTQEIVETRTTRDKKVCRWRQRYLNVYTKGKVFFAYVIICDIYTIVKALYWHITTKPAPDNRCFRCGAICKKKSRSSSTSRAISKSSSSFKFETDTPLTRSEKSFKSISTRSLSSKNSSRKGAEIKIPATKCISIETIQNAEEASSEMGSDFKSVISFASITSSFKSVKSFLRIKGCAILPWASKIISKERIVEYDVSSKDKSRRARRKISMSSYT